MSNSQDFSNTLNNLSQSMGTWAEALKLLIKQNGGGLGASLEYSNINNLRAEYSETPKLASVETMGVYLYINDPELKDDGYTTLRTTDELGAWVLIAPSWEVLNHLMRPVVPEQFQVTSTVKRQTVLSKYNWKTADVQLPGVIPGDTVTPIYDQSIPNISELITLVNVIQPGKVRLMLRLVDSVNPLQDKDTVWKFNIIKGL